MLAEWGGIDKPDFPVSISPPQGHLGLSNSPHPDTHSLSDRYTYVEFGLHDGLYASVETKHITFKSFLSIRTCLPVLLHIKNALKDFLRAKTESTLW